MKISEQTVLNLNYNRYQPGQEPFEFCLNRSTKETSGDEFYWQHQEQLQKSDLHFEASAQTNSASNSQRVTENKSSCELTTMPQVTSINQHTAAPLKQSKLDLQSETTPLDFSFHSTPFEQKSFIGPIGGISLKNNQESDTKLQIRESCRPNYPNANDQLKHFHLFIQNEQVELTLNTAGLDHHREKELTRMIQDNLKNKGLSLKQLIINGVEND